MPDKATSKALAIVEQVAELQRLREEARAKRDFKTADTLRTKLQSLGVKVGSLRCLEICVHDELRCAP